MRPFNATKIVASFLYTFLAGKIDPMDTCYIKQAESFVSMNYSEVLSYCVPIFFFLVDVCTVEMNCIYM